MSLAGTSSIWYILYMSNSLLRQRINLLVPLLKDPDTEVRAAASSSIEQLEATGDVEQILTTLKTGDTGARIRSIYALGKIGGDKVLQPLIYCASRPEDDIRAAAIEVLGTIAHPSTFQTLLKSLDDHNSAVQARAIAALAHFPSDQSLCSKIRPYLDANDGMLEAEAAKTLAEFKDITAIPGIINLLSSQHPTARIAAAEALGKLPI